MIDIRLPNITGKTDTEQLAQIKSYLYQFAGQLQWALSAVEAGNGGGNVVLQQNSAGSLTEDKTPGSIFNQLKGLIIKSADIVNAYYDEITKLIEKNNLYAAYSDYGDFVEATNNALYADGTGITQRIDNIQQIFDKEGNILEERLVNGRIFSGILEYAYEGEAIVGIEVGQTTVRDGVDTFQKFARFTAERLAFYDAAFQDEPVAYISNYQLVITQAWVKGELKLGTEGNWGFVFDTTNGIALIPKILQ